jgi:hypothetical protein
VQNGAEVKLAHRVIFKLYRLNPKKTADWLIGGVSPSKNHLLFISATRNSDFKLFLAAPWCNAPTKKVEHLPSNIQ